MLIVNADDLGMTPGANHAIFDGFDKGSITHASIMANCDYFKEAMQGMLTRPTLNLGMHLNLTYGKALIPNPLYCDEQGYFNLSYAALLMSKDEIFLSAIKKEWEAQIKRVLTYSDIPRTLTHIDSHRHIHLIPHLYPIANNLAHQYGISRVRLIQENMIDSLRMTKRLNFILNGGIIKYFLLRIFSLMNMRYDNLYKDINFYSILYTGVISKDILMKLKNQSNTYEIMIHPSYPELDKNVHFYDENEKMYRISPDRTKELEVALTFKRCDLDD